jgi:hypothetical protein
MLCAWGWWRSSVPESHVWISLYFIGLWLQHKKRRGVYDLHCTDKSARAPHHSFSNLSHFHQTLAYSLSPAVKLGNGRRIGLRASRPQGQQ